MRFYDAHNHLFDPRLAGTLPDLARLGVAGAVVNGTREADWSLVRGLAAREAWVRPSYGLHPWYVAERHACWHEELEEQLRAEPRAAVGEIGLDRWVDGHHLPTQLEIFAAQWALAARLERPVTVHCLRAWGALEEQLRRPETGRRPFLLHAYGGPAEMVKAFAQQGAYFSFSASFLDPRKAAAAAAAFRQVPLDRLLVETDAPEMPPPESRERYPWRDPASGKRLNHPGHLLLAYEGLAQCLGMPLEELAGLVEKNFAALFG